MNAVGALVSQRYMYETGTTDAELAAVCVSLRKWAALNPHAMFRQPLTVEEVLASKMIADPLRAKHCNMLADGAALCCCGSRRTQDDGISRIYPRTLVACDPLYVVARH
jgi:acetyl-CoA acetyltransferase